MKNRDIESSISFVDNNHENKKAEHHQDAQPFGILNQKIPTMSLSPVSGSLSSNLKDIDRSLNLKPDKSFDGEPIARGATDHSLVVVQILNDLMPYITSHGGHVEFVSIKDQIVYIKFSGTCAQCPMSMYTVTYGIERHIKVKLPWIVRVEVVDD